MRARPLSFALAALLLATPALAQERPAPLTDDFRSWDAGADVRLEAPQLLPVESETADEAGVETQEEAEARADAPPATPVQEVGSRNWLYLVAAIVAGGIILAVLL